MENSKKITLLLITSFIIILVFLLFLNKSKDFNNSSFLSGKIKAANLSTDYNIDVALADILALKLNTVNVPVVINIEALDADDMNVNSESEQRAIALIKRLKEANIKVVIEPYPWIKEGELSETNWQPKDIDVFFTNWNTKVLDKLVKDVANPCKVNAIIISSNMINLEAYESQWCATIDEIKKNYKGLVSYKTNWWYTSTSEVSTLEAYNKKLNNTLFSKVDFISVAAYFELSDNATNSVDELVGCLEKTKVYNRNQNIKQELKNFNIKWNKPVYLGELGFPKRNFAAYQPWNSSPSTEVNSKEQANCFEAYRRVFEKEDWLLGFSVFAIGEHSEDKHYLPGDESIKVINEWYKYFH